MTTKNMVDRTGAFLRGLTIGCLVAGAVAAAAAVLTALFLPAQPAPPTQPARPASPTADDAETAEGRRVAETQAHLASAAR